MAAAAVPLLAPGSSSASLSCSGKGFITPVLLCNGLIERPILELLVTDYSLRKTNKSNGMCYLCNWITLKKEQTKQHLSFFYWTTYFAARSRHLSSSIESLTPTHI